jgi:hypothetical protein
VPDLMLLLISLDNVSLLVGLFAFKFVAGIPIRSDDVHQTDIAPSQ